MAVAPHEKSPTADEAVSATEAARSEARETRWLTCVPGSGLRVIKLTTPPRASEP